MTTETLASFLGWCLVINFSVLVLATLSLVLGGKSVRRIHAQLFPIDEEQLPPIYFQFLANYKLAIFVFNLAPYLALKIMG
ncbi:DUF6868 family protein [Novipirellula artificiosorum]|uniref:DUF6868 domain-containing protein n=1 Tax=Novipirellula artificiosorum TaxID=2528016 RepID=A0A5C6E162_9BACT|nr:hypothetical protein [Novipirellula artificiosorum]TWU42622.1 hypothetical protein Poly41_09200 [Novipirellula artificiosorum]